MWDQLEVEKSHIAYACIGIFSTLFSLFSLFVKERLYIGEATVATIAGLILGPHCLNWFDPLEWGNSDSLTLEISRIVLCIQIVAVAVELPRKYMKKHVLSIFIFLVPVMTAGWLTVGLFLWALIPHFDFPSALLVSACVTATDPVLAAAVVGKGKFAERVPGHLRNILTAESGCNDGMAFPFIFLSLYIIIHPGNAREIVKDFFCLTILYECLLGVVLGVVLGYILRKAVKFAESKALIDRESFLAFFVFLAFNSAGIGSMLGVDDLLMSFAAGTAFGWNGEFAKKTEESHVSTVIDLILNLAFFVYFGAIVPWDDFNAPDLGLDVWRLIILAIVVIFLRRIPAVMALKPFTPDVKTWREALFCGHFGPIGVGAIFAAITARSHLESHYTDEETPLAELPSENTPHYQLMRVIWPIVTFIVIVSIIVHGSSVAVMTLGKRLNRMAFTMTFTATNTQEQGSSWMSRLQKLDHASTSFSLHRIDSTDNEKVSVQPTSDDSPLPQSNTIETSGVKVRPAGGARRKRAKKARSRRNENLKADSTTERQRPQTEFLQLGKTPSVAPPEDDEASINSESSENNNVPIIKTTNAAFNDKNGSIDLKDLARHTGSVYEEGRKIILENEDGEVIDTVDLSNVDEVGPTARNERSDLSADNLSVHSMGSLRRHMSEYSVLSEKGSTSDSESFSKKLSRTLSGKKSVVKKGDSGKQYFAYQVDDLLVIENADGDIVRRYRLNRHPSTKTRQRSGSLVGRALSIMGIKNKDGGVEPSSPSPTPVASTAANIERQPSVVDEEEESIESPSEEANSFADETEVEKKRRLAALGQIENGRHQDDEEET